MKTALISFCVATLVAILVYFALPATMYVEKAGNIIVLSFIGAAAVAALILRRRRRPRG